VITVLSATLMSAALMLPAQMTSVASLGASLLVFGAGFGGLNVAINSLAVDIVGRAGRPMMPSFHAAFSFGGLAGSVVGGVIASVLSASAHLTAVGVFGLAVTGVLSTYLLRSRPLAPAPPQVPAPQREGNRHVSAGPAGRGGWSPCSA